MTTNMLFSEGIKGKHRCPYYWLEDYSIRNLTHFIEKEFLPYVPYRTMADLRAAADIEINVFGYVHCVGLYIEITIHGEDRDGTGWDYLNKKYRDAVEHVKWLWDLAQDSYHELF